jgi:hypothetical protein
VSGCFHTLSGTIRGVRAPPFESARMLHPDPSAPTLDALPGSGRS